MKAFEIFKYVCSIELTAENIDLVMIDSSSNDNDDV